ncbi:COG1361 S-layer family protein [Aggregatilinea lenta]|uniref:COG1361 S-layer family protein n=1 Tax=Aggregatilinea lenta TaxID=913108 RepID=UPI000E5A6917|nr:hypothetical protein [Aggregatilinea lenta]
MSRNSERRAAARAILGLAILVTIVALWQYDAPAGAQGPSTEEPTFTPTNTPTPTPTSTPTNTPVPTDTPVPTATLTLTPSATATQPPAPVQVTRSEPNVVVSGSEAVLSVFGAGFTDTSAARLVGVGLLDTTLINGGALKAIVPPSVGPGQYTVQVNDAQGNWISSPNPLIVVPPTPTPLAPTDVPPPTSTAIPTDTPVPTNTPLPPTPVPGQPSLLVRNFVVSPAVTGPGGRVFLTFEVVNQGSRTAEGISATVGDGSKFVPANGQAGATLPDIAPGGSASVSLGVNAADDAPPGPNSIPVSLTYYDFEGNAFSTDASLSVIVSELAESSQIVLASYTIDPESPQPGDTVRVTLHVTNTGNAMAQQVIARITGADSILLPGPDGDSLPIGSLAPGQVVEAALDMILDNKAEAGLKVQPVTLSFMQDGEPQEVASSVTVAVASVTGNAPLLLLDAYDVGADQLQPGEQFTLALTLKNVGDGAVSGLLVTFGTVESTGGSTGGDSGTPSNTGGIGSGSSTTPSTTFAPLGGGGTIFVGDVGADGESVALNQDFIVNGTVNSGIYSLPITLRYQKPDGTSAQDDLRASVVVVAPPRVQLNLQAPLPETINVGEPYPLAITVVNMGSGTVSLLNAVTEADNGEIVDGADQFIGPVQTGDDATVAPMVMPLEEGPVEVTLKLHYLNDLNQDAVLVKTYTLSAVAPPPMPEEVTPPPDMQEVVVEDEDGDTIGRILLGLLGLGS